MRNLFLRFFLTYWLAFVLVGMASFFATQSLAEQRREAEYARQEQLAETARAVLVSRGASGLHQWLQDSVSQADPDSLLFIVDDRGNDLLQRQLPGFVRARLGRPDALPPQLSDAANRALAREVRIVKLLGPAGEAFDLYFGSRRRLMNPFGTFRETQWIASALTLLVSAGLSLLLARYFTRPIRVLRDATHSIAAGNLSVQVAGLMSGRRDELGALAVDFDAMAVRLRVLLEARQTLLRDVSHELRSPLTRLQIALGLARRPGANLSQELERIEREAQRLEDLIGEILSLSRLDDPVRQLEREDVDMHELLDTLCESARLEGAPRQVSVQLLCPANLRLQGDHELLYRAVENVLRNAVRFSPQGGEVRVHAAARADNVSVSIDDQGQGVPAEATRRIFEPFYRVGTARDRDSGGHGIGLAIAARVITLHNGHIDAANLPAGGLRVNILLPLNPAGDQAVRQQR
jgi:two-component system, OmpR family, sensor kinase